MCPSALISILMTGIAHLICCAQWEKKKRNHSFQGQTSDAKCDCFVHVNKITFCFDSTSGSHLQCVYCTYHSNDDLPVSTICLKTRGCRD